MAEEIKISLSYFKSALERRAGWKYLGLPGLRGQNWGIPEAPGEALKPEWS